MWQRVREHVLDDLQLYHIQCGVRWYKVVRCAGGHCFLADFAVPPMAFPKLSLVFLLNALFYVQVSNAQTTGSLKILSYNVAGLPGEFSFAPVLYEST